MDAELPSDRHLYLRNLHFNWRNLREKIVLQLILVFLSGFAAFSQHYQFRNYSIEQGLSQSVVNCVIQDSRGFVWVGTQNGLNRFNGYDFTEYLFNPDDSTTLSNNWVYSIAEDGESNIWVGTKGGLNKYIRKENRFKRISFIAGYTGSISQYAYDVLVSASGKVYVNTPPVLTVYDPGTEKFSHFPTAFPYDGVINDNRIPLMEDQDGMIWMGSNVGLTCFYPKSATFSYFLHDPSMPGTISDNRITALCQDSKGTIWVGTSNGLNLINKKSGEISRIFNAPGDRQLLSNNFIRAIIRDRNGAMWVGTEGGGLNRILSLTGQSFLIDRYSNAENGLGHNIVNALAVDRSQNLWAGTLQGISKTDLKPSRFALYRRDNTTSSVDLLGNVIASIYKDDQGLIWIGNWGQGLNIFNRKTGAVEHFSSRLKGNHYIPNDFVHVIFADELKNVWIGTRDGIFVFDKARQKFIRLNEFFNSKNLPNFQGMRIFMIIRGKDNSYWIATQGGLFRIDSNQNKIERFTAESPPDHQIGANLVYCLHEDRDGYLWIATINGVDVYNPKNGNFKRFRKNDSQNSLCDNFVISLGEDKNGDIWIGTGAYVNKFVKKDSTFLYYSKEHGIPRNNIFEIMRDDQNTLWFATGGGLCKFDSASNSFRNYTVDDGLQSLEFNLRACYKSPDGEVFFGGMNGLNSFYPGALRDNPYIPEIIVTACYKSTKGGKEFLNISESREVVIDYGNQAITIEFVALEFTNPEKNHYAYMLDGLSNEWIDIGNRRFVPFSNLSPGEYIFRVKGSNNDGKWNEKGATLKIVILPPWWRSWWAWAAYILLIAGALMIFVRIRERNLVLERNLLEKRIHERTLQIENKNQEILHKNETLNELNAELKALNETKDKFFSIIAHDLRNPFNSIIGLTDIVLVNLAEAGQEKTLKTVSDIREASRHAFDLLQNLLIWARSQTGNLEFQPTSFDLMERIEDNIELVRGQATRKNILLISEVDVPVMVHADSHMINTILRNLLTNAIKFTPREGRVSVAIEKPDGFILIRVCDNGVGITPEIREKIFKIESKYTHKGTDQERGTGLGLILCKEFAEKHGGSITVESEPGMGSCFTIKLPGLQ
jgi:signal transduction histidine kinase/ligand-binding sensor domain-containing protein